LPPVRMLPPAPVTQDSPRFDLYRHDFRMKTSSAQTRLSYSDIHNGMHITWRGHDTGGHVTRRKERNWANDPQKIGVVVAAMLTRRLFVRVDLTRSDFELADRIFERQSNELIANVKTLLAHGKLEKSNRRDDQFRSIFAVRAAGGLSKFYTAIIYRSLCLGYDSAELAQEMGMTPVGVRQTLYRSNILANQIEAGTYKQRHAGSLVLKLTQPFQLFRKLEAGGASFADIAAFTGHDLDFVRTMLRKRSNRFRQTVTFTN
jgi:hypothetical protein